jgi:hypothetical protein
VLWQFAGDHFNLAEIELLNKASRLNLETIFAKLLTNAEISALKLRISNLISAKKFPFPSDEWPAIPWPPV